MVDAAALAEELSRFRVIPADRLREMMADFPGGGAMGLAEFLVARGALTTYQAERALSGYARTLALGPYRVLDPHRVGTYGPIFRAEKAGTEYAIRVLPLRSLWQANQAKHLIRALSAQSPHPSVVPLVDADSANGYHYLVWPLVLGELLTDRVQATGPLPTEEVARLLAQLAAGLAACHVREAVHGLITPNSVLLNRNRMPQLLEIGAGMLLAKNLAAEESFFDTMSTSIAVAGAFEYAAPEWIADPSNPTAAGDQYSLGAIGFFALTGSPPPMAEQRASLRTNPSIPAELAEVLDRLLQLDPADRFSTMEEAHDAISLVAGVTEKSEREEPIARSAPQSRLAVANGFTPMSISSRAVERDASEASIQFDIPADAPEEALALAEEIPVERVEAAPRPAPPPPEPRCHKSLENKLRDGLPPVLPATPLPAAESSSRSAGSWLTAASLPKPEPSSDGERAPGSILKKVKRSVLFWQAPGDTVQVSVFGPPTVAHCQAPKFTIYLHNPAAAESVKTLARAFHHDAELLGSGSVAEGVSRGSRLDVHLAVEHIAVSNPLGGFNWKGQPHRMIFELVVPWEAPVGPASGVVSIGRDQVRIAALEFQVPILDGKG